MPCPTPIVSRLGTCSRWRWTTAQPGPKHAALLLNLAPKMERAGFRHEWIPFLQSGFARAQQWDDGETAAELALQLGYLYLRLRQWMPARRWLHTAHDLCVALGSPRKQAVALVRLAQVARYEEKRTHAKTLVDEAEALLEETDEEHGYCCFVRGLIAQDEHHWEEGYAHFERGLEIWTVVGNKRQLALCHLNLGLTTFNQHQISSTLVISSNGDWLKRVAAHYQQALSLFNELGDRHHQAIVQMNWGNAAYEAKNLQEALVNYTEAEIHCQQLQDDLYLAMVYHNQALTYHSLQEWENAETAFQNAIKLHHKLGRTKLRLNSIEGLGLVYLDQQRYNHVIEIYEKALDDLNQLERDGTQPDSEWHRLRDEISRGLERARVGAIPNR